jgi:hypothetical protein
MPNSTSASESPTTLASTSIGTWLQRHQDKFWWLHSGYALLLGIGVMWLGAHNYEFLRFTVFHVGFIWLSSLCLPWYLNHSRLSDVWTARLQLLINYFNKNFYQQVLFFILPIYYASATLPSRNVVFLLLLAISAILSTLDVVYDRHLSVRRGLTASFFAFNLFALFNVMLPVLWSISNIWTTRVATVLAAVGFVTLYQPFAGWKWLRPVYGALAAVLFAVVVEVGRGVIPPAPLRLVSAQFGGAVQREAMQVEPIWSELSPGRVQQVYVLTAIRAPLGLRERVRHRWYKEGKLFWASPYYLVTGGRDQGFRLWTAYDFASIEAGAEVRVDVETEGGQLIGRAKIMAGKANLQPVS